jgi:hypothetical protein
MGNKTSSSHLINHQTNRSIHQQKSNHYITNNDDINNSFDTSLYRSSSSSSKKYGPSPRSRRRHTRQTQLDKKTKKAQV